MSGTVLVIVKTLLVELMAETKPMGKSGMVIYPISNALEQQGSL